MYGHLQSKFDTNTLFWIMDSASHFKTFLFKIQIQLHTLKQISNALIFNMTL